MKPSDQIKQNISAPLNPKSWAAGIIDYLDQVHKPAFEKLDEKLLSILKVDFLIYPIVRTPLGELAWKVTKEGKILVLDSVTVEGDMAKELTKILTNK